MIHHRSAQTTDELTLHLIATGIIRLSEQLQHSGAIYPYPIQLQRGLDRLGVAALRLSKQTPQGIPALLDWCSNKPLNQWPLNLPEGALGPDDTLLINHQPSSICDAWACENPDVEAELTERRIMQSVFELCDQTKDMTAYRAFRTLVIQHPVLTALDFQQACIRPDLLRLNQPLRDAYQPISVGWARNRTFHCCKRCGNLLIPLLEQGFSCETPSCQRHPVEIGTSLPQQEAPYWLIRGLRRFVSEPGRAELRLAQKLVMQGIDVELWPMLDRYDLRLTFPSGTVWAVDVKDWANPFLLARNVKPIPQEPAWERAFFVFPDERHRQRPDYLRAFRHACSILNSTTSAWMERDFIKHAKHQLKSEAR